jgi:hypothetical protein
MESWPRTARCHGGARRHCWALFFHARPSVHPAPAQRFGTVSHLCADFGHTSGANWTIDARVVDVSRGHLARGGGLCAAVQKTCPSPAFRQALLTPSGHGPAYSRSFTLGTLVGVACRRPPASANALMAVIAAASAGVGIACAGKVGRAGQVICRNRRSQNAAMSERLMPGHRSIELPARGLGVVKPSIEVTLLPASRAEGPLAWSE